MDREKRPFYCGVVEGFYGCPWTTHQRKTLFERLQKLQMDTYLYAPKDDCKHRMYWRDLYSVEEADHLTGLIKAATERNIVFVYALSPGLDITYSTAKEVHCLKRKLEQVASFGCTAFALLFDDIDVDMSEADKAIYQSFAQAQVSVTNEVYQHLNQPDRFLFCPTEYCSSRAVPTVPQSEYLNTIGSRLLPGIDIMWTGPKVISKHLTVEHIEEISSVLRRPPVIWDNIHANDYDQKRLFLGPYDGRSSALIPRLRGVLTNPNCEFEANYIAMHTLAQWSRSYRGDASEAETLFSSSPVQSDIRLETEGEFGSSEDLSLMACSYRPKEALKIAVADWLELFSKDHTVSAMKITIAKPVIIAPPANTTPAPNTAFVDWCCSAVAPPCDVNESLMQPQTVTTVNSLVSDGDSCSDSGAETSTEPMDCVLPHPNVWSAIVAESISSGYDSGIADCSVAEGQAPGTEPLKLEVMQIDALPLEDAEKFVDSNGISIEDLHLLVDLFNLPFEHGKISCELLTELVWLKVNCCAVGESKATDATEDQIKNGNEWKERALKFKEQMMHVNGTLDKFLQMPNQIVLKDLFSYIWDMKTILTLVETFVDWLAIGSVSAANLYFLQGSPYTWANLRYQEAFQNGCQEPWVFRGGLQTEFQRILPLDGTGDLLIPVLPQNWKTFMLKVRPYLQSDEASVYEICRKTYKDGLDGTEMFTAHSDLVGDRFVGNFTALQSNLCFVLENSVTGEVCGYAVAALDAQDFMKRTDSQWLPTMQQKYPKPEQQEGLSPAEELMSSFHETQTSYAKEELFTKFPSLVRVDMLSECRADPTAFKRLLMAAVMALKTHGSSGVCVTMPAGNRNKMDAYAALNFFDAARPDKPDNLVVLGRAI